MAILKTKLKTQITISKFQTKHKLQMTNGDSPFEYFGFWIFVIVWNLVLGYWNLEPIHYLTAKYEEN